MVGRSDGPGSDSWLVPKNIVTVLWVLVVAGGIVHVSLEVNHHCSSHVLSAQQLTTQH